MSDEHDWLGDLPGVKDIQDAAGITYPRRARLRVEGATVIDDPVGKRTVIRIPDPLGDEGAPLPPELSSVYTVVTADSSVTINEELYAGRAREKTHLVVCFRGSGAKTVTLPAGVELTVFAGARVAAEGIGDGAGAVRVDLLAHLAPSAARLAAASRAAAPWGAARGAAVRSTAGRIAARRRSTAVGGATARGSRVAGSRGAVRPLAGVRAAGDDSESKRRPQAEEPCGPAEVPRAHERPARASLAYERLARDGRAHERRANEGEVHEGRAQLSEPRRLCVSTGAHSKSLKCDDPPGQSAFGVTRRPPGGAQSDCSTALAACSLDECNWARECRERLQRRMGDAHGRRCGCG